LPTNGLRPFFCFYGGKWRAAHRYPKPEHDTIVEPFAGAAGYATRYFQRNIILVERDPVIAALWRYLIRVRGSEVRALPDVPIGGTVKDLQVSDEARSLIGFWLNKGAAQPCNSPSAWMRSGSCPSAWWGPEIRDRIAAQVDHIRHWRVVEGSYENSPSVEATWFIDPPYQHAGKLYRFGSSELKFDALAHWVKTRRGLVVVCENAGASWLSFERFGLIRSNPSKRGRGFSAEAIYVQRST
jgi:hypothetical protein